MRLIACLLLLAAAPLPARALDDWTSRDTAWEATYLALHLADWYTTRRLAERPGFEDGNPLIGRRPGPGRVDLYMASTAVAHVAIARVLAPRYRRFFQVVTIGLELPCVGGNSYMLVVGRRF